MIAHWGYQRISAKCSALSQNEMIFLWSLSCVVQYGTVDMFTCTVRGEQLMQSINTYTYIARLSFGRKSMNTVLFGKMVKGALCKKCLPHINMVWYCKMVKGAVHNPRSRGLPHPGAPRGNRHRQSNGRVDHLRQYHLLKHTLRTNVDSLSHHIW